jgi:RNA polymerase sigma-70 factor (ECF subfamily)
LNDRSPSPLVGAYLRKRQDLVRYFTLRLGSAAAAEDLVQEIYLRIAQAPPVELASPEAWLYRVGSNLMLDRIKQQRRAAARDEAWQDSRYVRVGGEETTNDPPAEEALDARRRLSAILHAVEALPPQRQRAFRLHKLDGLSHAETAQAMGVSRSAVEKHISAALRLIASRLGR